MRSILVIDDDPVFRAMLNTLLAGNGWSVLEAEDGAQGLEMVRDHRPEIVICDLLMPRCNGFQFCRTLRSRPQVSSTTRIIVTSGSGYATDRFNALEAGANEYLTKPVRANELFALLEKHDTAVLRKSAVLPPHLTAEKGLSLRFWGVRGSILREILRLPVLQRDH